MIDIICTRLRVPATPSEIAATIGISLRVARAYLYQLRKQGRAVRTDKRIHKYNARDRQYEHLWEAVA